MNASPDVIARVLHEGLVNGWHLTAGNPIQTV